MILLPALTVGIYMSAHRLSEGGIQTIPLCLTRCTIELSRKIYPRQMYKNILSGRQSKDTKISVWAYSSGGSISWSPGLRTIISLTKQHYTMMIHPLQQGILKMYFLLWPVWSIYPYYFYHYCQLFGYCLNRLKIYPATPAIPFSSWFSTLSDLVSSLCFWKIHRAIRHHTEWYFAFCPFL